ncbi:hypothetical protein [Streptomyces cyanogenus]|uniref:Uncharacterized protein n=1 Tax=Streptomyces cyanogenus TaxID=80860 RepID=A0ABX7TJJ5_STRCY|nr:hypothetical protein S1361_05730 [Streptomyces cyanogenus]
MSSTPSKTISRLTPLRGEDVPAEAGEHVGAEPVVEDGDVRGGRAAVRLCGCAGGRRSGRAGKEPPTNGSGPDGTRCKYSANTPPDITCK